MKENICIKCKKEYNSGFKYCPDCGGKIAKKREDYIHTICKICRKPIYVYKDASQYLCDYHWEIFDAMDGW